ncbi:multiple inositol polyphosphate phosphatase 1-like [Apis laboriosa]|uniref:multiple inositol polyphosphate phosphatase 1-like n=1 Tax=Apis laboriosa TaxID=183418 RepID=UPI001CC775A3|nr:multiple inositol polyphosphate phosphatase 1-like [Apis laboriosa]
MNAYALFLTLLISHVYARDVDFCFKEENDPYLYMGTKTAYHFVYYKDRLQSVPNCQAKQIWMLVTHGTRCPSKSEIIEMVKLKDFQNQIINNHELRNNGHMCNKDLENLKKWKQNDYLMIQRAKVLAPQGVEDMRLLARRLQSTFPHLLQSNNNENITEQDYVFKESDAYTSSGAFMEGLFKVKDAIDVEKVPDNDTLLTMYKTCDSWDNEYNNASYEEVIAFEESEDFENLVKNVSRRLGFFTDIPKDLILTMYDMCRYEKAWTVTQLSPWCAVFSKEELHVLEYREDLYYYYKAGYGREINARLGCTLLQDMMNHFWKVEQENESNFQPKGIFYFSDTISLLNLLTTLNINKDEMQLAAFNYKEMAKRQWRTSFISSFAANLIAVFYKCDINSQPTNHVMFYLAEKSVMLKGCKVGLCDWEYIKQKFNPVLKQCDMKTCWNENGVAISLPNFVLLILSCFSLIFIRE